MARTFITRRAQLAAVSALAALALGLTACTGSGSANVDVAANTVPAELSESITAAVENALTLSGSTNAIVGVWGEAGQFVQAFGEGVSPSDHIRGAQATQPAVCALLISLEAEDVVQFDDLIAEDLPRQVGIDGITYAQLCDATSGLADYKTRLLDLFTNNPSRPWSDRELFANALAHSPLSEPGTAVHLSDSNSLLLARALTQVTGEKLPALLERHVFQPAGMSSSYFPADLLPATELENGMPGLTYPRGNGGAVCDAGVTEASVISPSMLSTAGGTVTTVTDLKNFYSSYLAGTFGASSAELITTTAPTATPEDQKPAVDQVQPAAGPGAQAWGFGLENVESLYGLSGAMTGTLTAAYQDPASDFTVVVSLNNSSAGAPFARSLAFQLAAIAGLEVSWSADDMAAALTAGAVCQTAPAAE